MSVTMRQFSRPSTETDNSKRALSVYVCIARQGLCTNDH
uniref:Transposase n=1 Tax=Heterorhabditis bacteriophora TaxID=37862 RepID=A0A1I7XA83_HETBA